MTNGILIKKTMENLILIIILIVFGLFAVSTAFMPKCTEHKKEDES